MAQFHPAWVAHQRKRWLRPNAHLWLRPDLYRFMPPGSPRYVGKDVVRYLGPDQSSDQPVQAAPTDQQRDLAAEQVELLHIRGELAAIGAELKYRRLLHARKYSPDQPRVPAGNPGAGQWTNGGTSGGAGRNDPRVVSHATPDNEWKPGAQYAAGRGGRASVPVRIGGRIVEVEPGQAARLAEAEARAQGAMRRVRELDPAWKPTPSLRDSVEGEIRAAEAEAREAEARLIELARNGIGPGLFARKSIPARGPDRNFTAEERREINRIGSQFGCHTCGTFDSGTPSGNYVLDHQPPTAWNPFGRQQDLYPQCLACSLRQGNWISRNGGRR